MVGRGCGGHPNIDEAVVFDDAELRSRGNRRDLAVRPPASQPPVATPRSFSTGPSGSTLIAACGVPVRAGIGWNGRGPFLTRQAYEGPRQRPRDCAAISTFCRFLGSRTRGEMEFFVPDADSLSAERILR